VTTIEFPLFMVGGDKILLMEKFKPDPLGAVLLKEFVSKTCWPTVEHDSVEDKKLFVDLLVHP
jgi:hypothetical protein